jgi:hypothetical protein
VLVYNWYKEFKDDALMNNRAHFGHITAHLTDSLVDSGKNVARRLVDMGNGYFLDVRRFGKLRAEFDCYLCVKTPTGGIAPALPERDSWPDQPKSCADHEVVLWIMDQVATFESHPNAAVNLRPDSFGIHPVSHSLFQMSPWVPLRRAIPTLPRVQVLNA